VEKEKRGAASRAFWAMVMSTVRRRSLLALWPDVFALPTLQKAHQEIMAELQATQLPNALPLPFLNQSNAQVAPQLIAFVLFFLCVCLSRFFFFFFFLIL
jgi:hypothetical protein